jgi:outer membrane protein OmpA-like peptidoglycan-associated protein
MHRSFLFIILSAMALGAIGCSLSRELGKMDDAEDFDVYAEKWAPSEDAFVAVQRVAKPHLDRKDWAGASAVFQRYKPKFPGMEKRFDIIIALLNAPSQDLHVTNLGPAVNSPSNEIKPSVTTDGTRLYFASDRPGGRGDLDIYVSKLDNGKWGTPQNLGERINTPDHETINGISFDGTQILLYGGFAGHLGNGDNYYFEKTENGWSAIKHYPPPVNGNSYDSDGFITADGKALIFTSDREGVVGRRVTRSQLAERKDLYHGSAAGNSDIWVSVKRGNYWLPPINLGPVINTPYCERAAFLHPDGRTLYFASDGHPGLGKLDVFKSVRLREDSWTEWSEPVNLGKDINTSEDDWGYKISVDGIKAYFSASGLPGGQGMNDIYEITLPQSARPEAVATLRGRIVDAQGNPVGATIRWGDLEHGGEGGELKSDPQTGEFAVTLPYGKLYELYFERQGYYPDSKFLDLRGGPGDGSSDGNRNGRDDGSGNTAGGNRTGNNSDSSGNNRNGDPNDPNGRNGRNGRNGTGSDSSGLSGAYAFDVQLKSVDDMRSQRDKWGELLAQRVNNIFFDFGKWDLKSESSQELNRLARFLETNPDIRIQIGAHTDDVGTDVFNQELSGKRARSVVEYLVQHGIAADRLVAKGYGESRPEVPNDTDENRARNRRVEFRIAE